MEDNKINQNISFTITISTLFAISISYLMNPNIFNTDFAQLMAQFYGITIVALICLYVLLQLTEYPITMLNRINQFLLLNLLSMAAALYIIMFPGNIDLTTEIWTLFLIIAYNIGVPVAFSLAMALVYLHNSMNSLIEQIKRIKLEIYTKKP